MLANCQLIRFGSVGEAPYNILSKYSSLNLTYPNTTYYECNLDGAACNSCDGKAIIANVTEAVA
jgi:hypothetical protein